MVCENCNRNKKNLYLIRKMKKWFCFGCLEKTETTVA